MKWWIPAVIIALILIPCIAGATVTTIVETSLNSRINTIDMSTVGNYTLVGTNDGNVTLYNTSGERKWYIKLRKGDPVRKVVINPEGNNFTAMTWGGYVLFGNAKTGATIAEFDGSNFSYERFQRQSATKGGFDNVTDIDMTDDGTKWFIVLNNTFIVKSSVNETLAIRTVDRNDGTFSPAGMEYGVIDPDGGFVVISPWVGSGLYLYKLVDNSSSWYQNYSYRRILTTGSTAYSTAPNNSVLNVTVYNTSGVSTGSAVYVGNRTRPDFRDVRFVNATSNTAFQIVNMSLGTNYANFTVIKTTDYAQLPIIESLYMYYGNVSANTVTENPVWPGSPWTLGYYDGAFEVLNPDFEKEGGGGWTCTTYSAAGTGGYKRYAGTFPDRNWSSNGTGSLKSETYCFAGGGDNCNGMLNVTSYNIPTSGATNVTVDYNVTLSAGASATAYAHIYATNGVTRKTLFINTASASAAHYIGCATVTVTSGYQLVVSSAGAIGVGPTSSDAAVHIDMVRGNWTNFSYGNYVGSVAAWFVPDMKEDAIPVVSTTLTDTITSMDIPWNSPYIAVGTSSTIVKTQPSTTGFSGTTSAADAGDKPDVSIVDGGVYTIAASSSTVNIYTSALVVDGTYDASTFNDVDIASSNGLWAVAGDSSGKFYVFSKEGTSGWELVYDSTASSVVTSVSISSDGLYGAVGREDGSFIMYYFAGAASTTDDFIQDVYIIKNGLPYIGATVYVDESTVVPYVWTRIYTKLVDSSGMFNFEATAGNYYRFNITDELDTVRAASSSHTAMRLYITSTTVPYIYQINVTDGGYGNNSRLYLNFTSLSGPTTFVNVTVTDMNSDQMINSTANWTGYTSLTGPTGGVIYTFQSNHTYLVKATILYPSGFRGEYVTVLVSKQISSDSGMPMIATYLDDYLDTQIMTALFTILLMIFAGLASYANAPKVAVGVVVFAAILSLTNVIAVPITIIMVAGGVAMLSAIARSVRS